MSKEDIEIFCELCGKTRGLFLKIDSLPDSIKPNEAGDYLHGMCQECMDHMANGATFFTDKNRRVMMVSAEGSLKLQPEFRGKVIGIPVSAFDELVRAWAGANLPPPEEGKN